jgi:hypothetical protein
MPERAWKHEDWRQSLIYSSLNQANPDTIEARIRDPYNQDLDVAMERWKRLIRSWRWVRWCPKRVGVVFMLLLVTLLVFRCQFTAVDTCHIMDVYNSTAISQAVFQPPEPGRYRYADTIDTFQSYKFRGICNISSLDLHAAFSPLCLDRASMLAAMASGGRIGQDAPYMPRGCDMRWFTSEEICEILGRFDKVFLIGDSMLRHMIGSINVFIRKDLGYGAVTDWNFSVQERYKFQLVGDDILMMLQEAMLLQRAVRCQGMLCARNLQDRRCAHSRSEEFVVHKPHQPDEYVNSATERIWLTFSSGRSSEVPNSE